MEVDARQDFSELRRLMGFAPLAVRCGAAATVLLFDFEEEPAFGDLKERATIRHPGGRNHARLAERLTGLEVRLPTPSGLRVGDGPGEG